MKCLETDKLISYAYHLADESAASEVRAHLEACPHCREIVEQHARLDGLLDEWKTASPRPGFDVRVRQAVEAQQASGQAWGFWGWGWTRGLALASLAGLMIAGLLWYAHSYLRVSHSSAIATRQSHAASSAQNPSPEVKIQSSNSTNDGGVRPAQAISASALGVASLNEDKDAQALEDYDLAANFDLLSELPKRASRVVN